MPNKWEVADRISDRIVEVLRDEMRNMQDAGDFQPLQLLAGQLLAFKALQGTMPHSSCWPGELKLVVRSVDICLESLVKR